MSNKIFDRVLHEINRGKEGKNVGLPYGIPELIEYMPNIQQSTYYAVAGEPASMKTALTDYMFMYSPFDWYMENKHLSNIKIKLVYWSFEISVEAKITKGVCQRIWKQFKILTDVNYVLSKGKNRISQEIYEKVLLTRNYFDELHDILEIHDVATNPTGITKRLEQIALENGVEEKVNEYTKIYRPHNPDLYFMTIIDHIKLQKSQSGLDTKGLIDFTSNKCIEYRNRYKMIPIIVSQFNRSLASAQRELSTSAKPNYDRIKPQLSDLADSSAIAQDANVILSIFSPNRYSIPNYLGYDITKLADRVRFIDFLKSRDGVPEVSKAVAALGEIGLFQSLPAPSLMQENHYSSLKNLKKYNN